MSEVSTVPMETLDNAFFRRKVQLLYRVIESKDRCIKRLRICNRILKIKVQELKSQLKENQSSQKCKFEDKINSTCSNELSTHLFNQKNNNNKTNNNPAQYLNTLNSNNILIQHLDYVNSNNILDQCLKNSDNNAPIQQLTITNKNDILVQHLTNFKNNSILAQYLMQPKINKSQHLKDTYSNDIPVQHPNKPYSHNTTVQRLETLTSIKLIQCLENPDNRNLIVQHLKNLKNKNLPANPSSTDLLVPHLYNLDKKNILVQHLKNQDSNNMLVQHLDNPDSENIMDQVLENPNRNNILAQHLLKLNRDNIPFQQLENPDTKKILIQHLDNLNTNNEPSQHLDNPDSENILVQPLENSNSNNIPDQHLDDSEKTKLLVQHVENPKCNSTPNQLLENPKSYEKPVQHLKNSNSKKQNIDSINTKIKKPLNAFMLYLKEIRSSIVAPNNVCSTIFNKVVGDQWNALGPEAQAKYFKQAQQERLLHRKLYPEYYMNLSRRKVMKRKRRGNSFVPGTNTTETKKCRAMYGVLLKDEWCNSCKRKKKCSRSNTLLQKRQNSQTLQIHQAKQSTVINQIQQMKRALQIKQEQRTKQAPQITQEQQTKQAPQITQEQQTKQAPQIKQDQETKQAPQITQEQQTKQAPQIKQEQQTKQARASSSLCNESSDSETEVPMINFTVKCNCIFGAEDRTLWCQPCRTGRQCVLITNSNQDDTTATAATETVVMSRSTSPEADVKLECSDNSSGEEEYIIMI